MLSLVWCSELFSRVGEENYRGNRQRQQRLQTQTYNTKNTLPREGKAKQKAKPTSPTFKGGDDPLK